MSTWWHWRVDIADADEGGAGSGSSVSFERFFDEEFARVVALMFTFVGDGAVAEELAQEAFARAFRRWGSVGSYERPGGWVRTVAVNLARSRFRRLEAERRARARLHEGGHVEFPEPADPVFERLWELVGRLPRRQATAVVLRYVDDLPMPEIAAVMGCAEATVRVHLHRARRTLAAELARPAERIVNG